MTTTTKQMKLPMGSEDLTSVPQYKKMFDVQASRWLGLAIADHRRLLEALQDDWLLPSSGAGFFLGIGTYAKEQDVAKSKHPISIRIKLDVTKLPELEVLVLRDEQWTKNLSLSAIAQTDTALYWPGALPTFAISGLAVGSEEERVRLTGLAGSFSNVELPDVLLTVCAVDETIALPTPPEKPSTLTIPREVDPLRGAMSMAAWAVPKIQPWLDLLVKGLANYRNSDSDSQQLAQLANKVEACWWRFLPWVRQSDAQPENLHDRFWLAALNVFRARSLDGGAPPRELATQIAKALEQLGCPSEKAVEWREATQNILRAESTIHLDNWQANPVGMAVQLVLARPEPTRFKTWYEDLRAMPPAVWWSAATLCGLYRGYRKLDSQFRCKGLRPYIAVRALRAYLNREISWPSFDGEPRWEPDTDGFAVFWGDKKLAHQPEHARGKWYRADFDDEQIRRMAETLAKDLDWHCVNRALKLKKCSPVPFNGSMKIKKKPEKMIEIDSPVTIMLPPDSVMEDVLDVESFRRHIVLAAGMVPHPPVSAPKVPLTHAIPVPGLKYIPNFIREDEETRIVEEIDLHKWSEEMQRRVQHYGWRYNYKARQVEPDRYLGPLPEWAGALAKRLLDKGLVRVLPDQVIVNEYKGKQGISKHVDSTSFGEDIATISLLESWEMIFRKDKQKHVQRLEQRSVAVMTGAARYDWTHEILQRQNEPDPTKSGKKNPSKLPRGRRLSLTFRKVLAP